MLSNCTNANYVLKEPVKFITSGVPPPPSVLIRAESLGFKVTHKCGVTETRGCVLSCAWKPEWDKLLINERAKLKQRQRVSVIGSTEADVVDPITGVSIKTDGSTLGEIVLRGGCIMIGYLKDNIATSTCMRDDGCFYTGDVGVMHSDGYHEIKDRSKDVIRSGGESISSVEVVTILYSNREVDEVAVVAQKDEFWGETPCTFVKLKKNGVKKVSENELIEFCRERLLEIGFPIMAKWPTLDRKLSELNI